MCLSPDSASPSTLASAHREQQVIFAVAIGVRHNRLNPIYARTNHDVWRDFAEQRRKALRGVAEKQIHGLRRRELSSAQNDQVWVSVAIHVRYRERCSIIRGDVINCGSSDRNSTTA